MENEIILLNQRQVDRLSKLIVALMLASLGKEDDSDLAKSLDLLITKVINEVGSETEPEDQAQKVFTERLEKRGFNTD